MPSALSPKKCERQCQAGCKTCGHVMPDRAGLPSRSAMTSGTRRAQLAPRVRRPGASGILGRARNPGGLPSPRRALRDRPRRHLQRGRRSSDHHVLSGIQAVRCRRPARWSSRRVPGRPSPPRRSAVRVLGRSWPRRSGRSGRQSPRSSASALVRLHGCPGGPPSRFGGNDFGDFAEYGAPLSWGVWPGIEWPPLGLHPAAGWHSLTCS